METFVKTSLESGVGRITLSRPEKRNALSRAFIEQLSKAVEDFSNQDSIRAVVFQAAGSVFCAGMDLGEMQQRAENPNGKQEWQKDSEIYADLLAEIYHLRVPTIAVLQGPVLAGGVGMILACDFVVAGKEAFVMLPEPARGITAGMVTPFLVQRIGVGPASHLLLSGERMPAQRAAELGLVYAAVESDKLDSHVDELLTAILTGSSAALQITKRHVQKCGMANLDELLKMSIRVSAEARETDDAREGLAAFLEKRKPNWQT